MTLIDSPETVTVPTLAIDASERSSRLTSVGAQWAKLIADDPSSAGLTVRVRGVGEGSVATRITAGDHEFLVDEPAALAGDGRAAGPVDYALGALIACQVVVYRLYSNALNIPFDDISVVADGDLDVRRLFGIDDSVRAGFSSVRLKVTVTGPESAERYQELQAIVDAHCPVFDLFTNPTPVSVTVVKG